MSQNILLAIGHQAAEEVFCKLMKDYGDNFTVSSSVVSKTSVNDFLAVNNVDILILREGFEGDQEESLVQFAIDLKLTYHNLRIIYVGAEKESGTKELAQLVTYQIFDIIVGSKVSIGDIANKTINPTTFAEASAFLPRSVRRDGAFDDGELDDVKVEQKTNIVNHTKTEVVNDVPQPSLMEMIKQKKTSSSPNLGSQGSDGTAIDTSDYAKISAQLKAEKMKRESLEKSNRNLQSKNVELNEQYELVKKEMINRDKTRNATSKQKVILFYGAMPGVGTTTAALNTAVYLAQKKQKVAFIEFNDVINSVGYWFDFGSINDGLEKAFLGIETRSFQDIPKCIHTKEKLLGIDSDLIDKFEKYPENLSFLFFSEEYIKLGESNRTNPNTLKDLLLFLLYKEGYDYVILDVYANSDFHILETASIFSSKNVFVMTQDVVTIGASLKSFGALQSNGLDFEVLVKRSADIKGINFKNIYLINKYDRRMLMDKKKIGSWLESDRVIYMPENSVEIVNSLFRAYPTALVSKNRDFLDSIRNLTDLF